MQKNVVITIVAVVTLIAYLFLPFMSFMGESVNMLEMITESEGELFGSDAGIYILLTIISAIAIIVGSVLKKNKVGLIFSIVGTIVMLAFLGALGEAAGTTEIMELIGMGYWLALIGFIANIVISAAWKEQ